MSTVNITYVMKTKIEKHKKVEYAYALSLPIV
jgi:hypothetical protein